MPELIVLNCRQVLTLAGPARPRIGPQLRDLAIINDGAILVRDGRIAATGPRRVVEPLCSPAAEIVDAGQRILLPGFVDAHTHPVFAGTRADEFEERIAGATYAHIASRGGGIQATVRRTQSASEAELLKAAQRYAKWFLSGGTTTIEAKSGYGLSLEAETRILRVIRQLGSTGILRTVPTFLGAHEVPDEYRGRRAAYTDLLIREMLPRIRQERLAEFCDVFCEPTVFPRDEARPILLAARQLGLGIRVHADQFSSDEGSLLAAEMNAATADHLERTSPAGLEALRASAVQPVLLPASVYQLGSSHYAAARNMIEVGLPLVIATDFNPGSSPTASIPMILSLACTQMKMLPAEAIVASTVNAAYSLGRGDQIGSLEPGKLADFAIHDCEDYRELAYFFSRPPVWKTFVGGSSVYSSTDLT